jgi:multidrug efflux pump subunit AcrA (membrane-fusion protein)
VRGKPLSGEIVTVIARGNVATRTFPVKVRVENNAELIEGMEVKVVLPTAEKQKSLAVNRDALITVSGQTVLFTVENSVANVLPVKVVGYDGMIAGVEAPGLRQGMDVVIKGNERLRPGQPVHIVTSSE